MTTTPDREQPGGKPGPDAEPTTPEAATEPGTAAEHAAATPPTGGSGSAARPGVEPVEPVTPAAPRSPRGPRTEPKGTSAHRASRPAPVPPAPEEPVPSALPTTSGPTTATVSPDGAGAPTAPLPATPAAGAAPAPAAPAPAPAGPVPPAEPVRRTSIRGAEARAATALTAGASVAGTTAAPDPAPAADLPGTGPSDASVPYGDASATTAPHPTAPLPAPEPGSAPDADDTRPRGRRSAPSAEPVATAPARRPGGGAGRHLLGVLVGLLLGAAGVWAALFGQARVLGVQAPGWDASYDPLGVVLVTAGVLVLAAVVGLGLWTPAVPLTAGAVASVVGVVYLYVPATTHVDTVRWFATDATRVSVMQTTVTATSGTVFLVGVLLLAAGLTVAVARRRWLPRA